MQLTLKGEPVNSCGPLPGSYDALPDFVLLNGQLQEVTLADFKTPFLLLNIFPSLDTNTCAASVRAFNEEMSRLKDITVLCISADLPFAQSRFCAAEGLSRVVTLSCFRSSFAKDYGVELIDGPLAKLCGRAVIIANAERRIIYTQLVPEISHEPDYRAALKVLAEGS